MAQLKGHRQLSESEVALLNEIKEQSNNLGQAIDVVEQIPDVDKRAIAIARTHLQTGFMWITRAIARPEGF